MQTPKARKSSSEVPQKKSPRSISSEVPQKISPRAVSSKVPQKITARGLTLEVPKRISPRAVCKLKTTAFESDSASSSNQTRTPTKDRSSKFPERRSPTSPVPEKKGPNRELDSQISQLKKDLKKVKDQVSLSESRKQQAQKDSESQDKRDSDESAALASALDEISQLKVQLEMVAASEAKQTKQAESASAELLGVKENLAETLLLAEDMKNQLRDCKESEVQAQALVGQTLFQLETAKRTVEALGSDNTKAMEAYNAIALELDQSRARVNFLEDLVNKLNSQNSPRQVKLESRENGEKEKSTDPEFIHVSSEVEDLRAALQIAEIRYHEEQIRNTMENRNAYELVEQIKLTSSQREAELVAELKKSKADIEELKANLMDKETELQGICEENDLLNTRLKSNILGQREYQLEKELNKVKLDAENLKASLRDTEKKLQTVLEENEMLKLGKVKKEIERGNVKDEVVTEPDKIRAAEQEALMKLNYMTEEADKSNRRANRLTEQLEAAQLSKSEMEVELGRVKVQSDQWRKAAEAAASMLSAGNNGNLVERTGSLDGNYNPSSGKISSPYPEDFDDDFLKKKNGNMLKRMGVLWKKQQK